MSANDGSTWTPAALTVPPPNRPYVVVEPNLTAMAAGGGSALVLGSVVPRVDWRAYSVEQLGGVDHGNVAGEGTADDGTGWRVQFEDGFELTVDPTEFGLDELMVAAPAPAAWIWEGSAWEQIDAPFPAASGGHSLVFGPLGYVTVTPSPQQGGGPLTYAAHRSADGRIWESAPLPDDLAGDAAPFLVGGPHGYVAIGESTLWHSLDAVTWTEVHRFEDPAPDMYGLLSLFGPSGGPAGFVIVVAHPDPAAGIPARMLASPDGTTWHDTVLESTDALTAVGGDSALVLPAIIDRSRATPRNSSPTMQRSPQRSPSRSTAKPCRHCRTARCGRGGPSSQLPRRSASPMT